MVYSHHDAIGLSAVCAGGQIYWLERAVSRALNTRPIMPMIIEGVKRHAVGFALILAIIFLS